MKKAKKSVSLILAILMVLALLPGESIAAAAEEAYTVLCEPNIEGTVWDVYGNAAVVSADVYHLMEYTGTEVKALTEEYVYMSNFTDSGHLVATKPVYDWWPSGIIDWHGETVIDFNVYEWFNSPSDDGYVVVHGNNEEGPELLNLNTGETIWWSYGESSWFNNGRVRYWDYGHSDGGYGGYYYYIDINGNHILGEYDRASNFRNGYACVRPLGEEYDVIIDVDGNELFSEEGKSYMIYSWDFSADDALFLIYDKETYLEGYVDTAGNIVIPCQYEYGSPFKNGYAVVGTGDGTGLIDTSGNVIVPFGLYDRLSNVSDEGLVWAMNNFTVEHEEDTYTWEETKSRIAAVLKVGQADSSAQTKTKTSEYTYDSVDPGADLVLPVEQLEKVKDPASAARAVDYLVKAMTQEQKESPIGIDLAALYAETATAKAARKTVNSSTVTVNAAAVRDLGELAVQANQQVESALNRGEIMTARYLSNTVTLVTSSTDISIQIDPDILTTNVDKVRVETPDYALTFKLSDLEPDLTQTLTFTAKGAAADSAASSAGVSSLSGSVDGQGITTISRSILANAAVPAVEIGMTGGKTTNSITVSLPNAGGDTTYQAVASADGAATASKYNPATTMMDGKVNTSGKYTVMTNEKDFTDISNKSKEMQDAIRYLASKGIINGTTATTFSPDGSISRAEIATLLVKALGKLDSTAATSFSDVSKGNWYYTAAASSQRHGLINGYEDNTFRGTNDISKVQIVAVSSRVLSNEMNYKAPGNPAAYLSKYKDTVANWAQSEVALATRENLVVYRTDGTFSGDKNMTRGDAAIIIYRLFQRIW